MPTKRRPRPNPFLLPLYRLPVLLYRLRLGWIFGQRFLMITHQGRLTGRQHRTVLEVIRHAPRRGEYIVVSGYGQASEWYRNLRACPALQVTVGCRSYRVEQRFLPPDEVHREYIDYQRRRPWLARTLPLHLGLPYDGSERHRRAVASALRMLAFRIKRP